MQKVSIELFLVLVVSQKKVRANQRLVLQPHLWKWTGWVRVNRRESRVSCCSHVWDVFPSRFKQNRLTQKKKKTLFFFSLKKKHLKLFCKKACFDNGVNTVTRNLLIGHPVNKEFMKIVSLVFVWNYTNHVNNEFSKTSLIETTSVIFITFSVDVIWKYYPARNQHDISVWNKDK